MDGYLIAHKRGKRPTENAYFLIAEPGEVALREVVEKFVADGWTGLPPTGELFRDAYAGRPSGISSKEV
jgi:hypothetical protein